MAPQNEFGWSWFEKKENKIPHYYGDAVRQLFIVSAITYAVAMPLFGNLLPINILWGIGIIIALVVLAALTNPHNGMILFFDVLLAATGVFLFEATAIYYYSTDSKILFFLRELSVILLIFALYYSAKSLRSMAAHKIGKRAEPGEFEKKSK